MKTFSFFIILSMVTLMAVAQRNARNIEPNDPNRDPNWDWTACCTGYTVYYATQEGIRSATNVQVPFYTQGNSLADAPNNDAKDMWKVDGWMLAYKDFGTATNAPPLPFFILYNKYRGILRVMVYNARESSSTSFSMALSFRPTSPKLPLFTLTNNRYPRTFGETSQCAWAGPWAGTDTGYDPNQVESVIGKANQLGDWFWGDFVVAGYYPVIQSNTILHLDLNLIDQSKLQLKSTKFTLDQVLKNSSMSNSKNFVDQGIASIDEGNRYFKTVDNVRAKFKETSERDKGEPWLKNVLGSIANSGGASIVPYLGGALGFVNYFVGGKGKAAPQEPISFKGVLEMDGTVTTTKPLISIDLAMVPSAVELPDYYRPVQEIPWGIFNMEKPYLNYIWSEPEYICGDYDCEYVVDDQGVTNYSCTYDCRWTSSTLLGHGFWGKLIVNPGMGMTLTSLKTSSILTTVKNSTTKVKNQPTALVAATYRGEGTWDYTVDRSGASFIGVELTFQINSPTKNSDRTIVIYKVYPNERSNYNVLDSYNAAVGTGGGRIASLNEEEIEEIGNKEGLEFQVFPNPVKESTTFQFHVTNSKGSVVSLVVYDLMGSPVKSIASNRNCPIGKYKMKWATMSDQGSLVSNGAYIAVLTLDNKVVSRKVIINR